MRQLNLTFCFVFINLLIFIQCGPGFGPLGSDGNNGGGGSIGDPGTLDTSFGTAGVVITNAGGASVSDLAYDVIVDKAGSIVIAGLLSNDRGLVQKYLPTGSLDTSFSSNGTAVIASTTMDLARALVADTTPSYFIVGRQDTNYSVVKLTSIGDLDAAFGTIGNVIGQFSIQSEGSDIQLSPDGKVVVVGQEGMGGSSEFGVARLNAIGGLDADFSGDGVHSLQVIDLDDIPASVQIMSDDRVMIVGFGDTGGRTQVAAARLLSDGILDLAFDSDGLAEYGAAGVNDSATGSARQPDQKVVTAGLTGTSILLTKIQTSGAIDVGFNGGMVKAQAVALGTPTINAVALQTDGKIIAVGSLSTGPESHFLLARFLSNGDIDTSFDTDGFVVTDFSAAGFSSDGANSVAIQSDGKIVVAGSSDANGDIDVAIARYNP